MPKSDVEIKVEGDKQQCFVVLLLELQGIVTKLTNHVLNRYRHIPVKPAGWVPVIILSRINETVKAATLLISNNFNRDAAVLLTCLMELRLDLLYISQDESRADIWLNHSNSYRKPWKVQMLLETLFKDPRELEAERELYKRYSMIKHGNPVAKTFAFPFALSDQYITMPSHEDVLGSNFIWFVYALFEELYRSLKAASSGFSKRLSDTADLESKADSVKEVMEGFSKDHVLEQLSLLSEILPKPELCNSCVSIPDKCIEITCLLKRQGSESSFTCDKYQPRPNDKPNTE